MPRCLPIETSGPCLSCIFTRSAPLGLCETSATARRTSGGSVALSSTIGPPAHDLADVGEAEHRQFAQNLLNRDFGPLGAGSEDFFDASANANIFVPAILPR